MGLETELSTDDRIVIEGAHRGDVKAIWVDIAPGATFVGNIEARLVRIAGRLEGNVDAEMVKFASSAQPRGAIACDVIGCGIGSPSRLANCTFPPRKPKIDPVVEETDRASLIGVEAVMEAVVAPSRPVVTIRGPAGERPALEPSPSTSNPDLDSAYAALAGELTKIFGGFKQSESPPEDVVEIEVEGDPETVREPAFAAPTATTRRVLPPLF